jgi:pimeloyl-ACP methyl ester carboxylesterase
MYEPILDELGKKYHCLAPDFPGFGSSSSIDNFSYDSVADWLKSFVDHLGIKKFHLLGVSLGGAVALSFTSKYPKYVHKLFLNSPPVRSIPARRRFSPLRTLLSRYRPFCQKLLTLAMDRDIPLLFYKYLPKYRLIDKQEILKLYQHCSNNSPEAILDSLDCILHDRLNLSKSNLPESLIVYGSQDYQVLLNDINLLRSQFDHLKFHEIKGANHSVSVSSPHRSEFIRLIDNFLD